MMPILPCKDQCSRRRKDTKRDLSLLDSMGTQSQLLAVGRCGQNFCRATAGMVCWAKHLQNYQLSLCGEPFGLLFFQSILALLMFLLGLLIPLLLRITCSLGLLVLLRITFFFGLSQNPSMKTRCSNRSFNMVSMEHWTVSLIFWLGLSPHSWLVCFLTEIGKVKYMIL